MTGLLLSSSAFADESDDAIQACAKAYEQAQVTRNNGQLVEAQEQLLICVQDVCPDFVKTDCGRWLSEVKREIPSVIFAAQEAHGKKAELTDVTVTMDGTAQVAASLDGKAVEVDPGRHEFVFKYKDIEVKSSQVIRQGEKNRVVAVEIPIPVDTDGDGFMDADDKCPQQPGPEQGCPPAKKAVLPPVEDKSGMRMAAYASWGVGGAGLVTFAVFGILGKAADKKARDACLKEENGQLVQNCPDPQEKKLLADVDLKNTVANIGAGVGIAGAAVGTVLFFLSRKDSSATKPEESVVWQAGPTRDGGGFVSVSGSF